VLFEAVEELFVDLRAEFHLYFIGLILHLLLLRGAHHLTTFIGLIKITWYKDVLLLLLGLITNQWQWHEERACH
jgi:hypothetical protein